MKFLQIIIISVVFFFCSTCNNKEFNKTHPKVVNGVLDLTQWNFDSSIAPGGTINLDGEWEFYWETFLNPSIDTPLSNPSVSNSITDTSNFRAENLKYIPVPSQWQNHGYPAIGYATYRLRLLLPPTTTDVIASAESLSIAMTDTYTAYEMYVSGKLASVNGRVGKSETESVPFMKYHSFSITPFMKNALSDNKTIGANIKPVTTGPNEIEIIIHVSNYHYFNAGLWETIKIGSSKDIDAIAKRKFVLDLIVFSVLLIMGLYHLGLHFNRINYPPALYFGIMCLSAATRIITVNERLILDVFPFLPFFIVHKLELLSFYCAILFLAQFVHSLFPEEFSQRLFNVIIGILLPCILVVIFFPMHVYGRIRIVALLVTLFEILYINKVLILAILHKQKGAILFLIGLIILSLAVTSDVLKAMGFIFTHHVASYGILVFIFFQAVILSEKFADAFTKSENLTKELKAFSESLEYKVLDRTRELEIEKQKFIARIYEFEKYNKILNDLSRSRAISLGNLTKALMEITEACSFGVDVERVSIWKYDARRNSILCFDLFELSKGTHSEGIECFEKDFPVYFKCLKNEKAISVYDVHSYPEVSEFSDYHIECNICSILTLPIWSSGKLTGLLSFESTENKRQWTLEEENFALSISGLIHNAFGSEERNLAQLDEVRAKAEMQFANEMTVELIESPSLDHSLMIIFDYILSSYKPDILALYFFDEGVSKNTLYKLRGCNIPEDQYNYIKNFSVNSQASNSLFSLAAQRKKITYIPKFHLKRITNALEKEFATTLELKSILLIPIEVGKEKLGMFVFFNLRSHLILEREEQDSISQLGYQIAGVIQKGKILQEVEKSKKQADIERGIALLALKEAEEAKLEIEKLNNITKRVNSVSNLTDIMTFILFYLQREYSFTDFWLLLKNEKTNDLSTFSYTTSSLLQNSFSFFKNFKLPLDEDSYLSSTFREQKILYLPIKENTHLSKIDRQIVEQGEFSYLLQIPFVIYEETIGIFCLHKKSDNILSEDTLNKLQTFSNQIAGAVFNSTLFKQAQDAKEEADNTTQKAEKQKEEIEALNKLIKSLNENLDIKVIMKKVHQYIRTNYAINYYGLAVVNKDKNEIVAIDSYSPEHLTEEGRERAEGFSTQLTGETGAHATSFKSMKPLYIRKISRLALTGEELVLQEITGFESLLIIPLILQNNAIGFLDLYNVGKMKLSANTVEKLSLLGEQLAGIINGSNLFQEVELEREKSDKLLLNILPEKVAQELKIRGQVEPVFFENASIMFTDFKGFTQIAEGLAPQELIKELDGCFSQFDHIIERCNLEKLKTIGDSYMCAGGIPRENTTHAIDACRAALEIQSFMNQMKEIKKMMGQPYWELRLGIHSGALMAGVVGEKKFAYDVWGDTVNTASRMESSGTPGKINISYATYELVKHLFDCEYRGEVDAKNKGKIKMYYLLGIKKEYAKDPEGLVPNGKFWELYAI